MTKFRLQCLVSVLRNRLQLSTFGILPLSKDCVTIYKACYICPSGYRIKYNKDNFFNAYKVLALLEVRNSELFAWLRLNLTPWSHHDFERIKKFHEGLHRRLPRLCTHLHEKLHKKNSLSGGYRQPFPTGKIQKVGLII